MNPSQVRPSFIAWIRANVPAGKVIVELGSGDGTTKELCQDYVLYSVEHSLTWIGKYKSNYIPTTMVNGWYAPEILQMLLPKNYDLLIVDGPIGKDRVNLITSFDLFRKDVPIILDDAERSGEKKIIEFLSRLGYVEIGWDRSFPNKQWVAMLPERIIDEANGVV